MSSWPRSLLRCSLQEEKKVSSVTASNRNERQGCRPWARSQETSGMVHSLPLLSRAHLYLRISIYRDWQYLLVLWFVHLGPWRLLIPVTEKNSLVTRHEWILIGCAVSFQFRYHCLSVASIYGFEVLRRGLVSIDKSLSSRTVRSLKLG